MELSKPSEAIHLGHLNMPPCEINSRRAIEKMKIEVEDEPTVDHKAIYDRNITLLLKKGHLLADIKYYIKPYSFVVKPYQLYQTLNQKTEKLRPSLPKVLRDIDLRNESFKEWIQTHEGKHF